MLFYCVIGYPIRHSLSSEIHNRAFRLLKIPARYEALEVRPENLAKFMREFRQKYAGGNVTIPHKVAVIQFLDKLSPEARKIGAVNTIVNKNGKLVGYNTDVFGAMEALRKMQKSKIKMQNDNSKFKNNKFLKDKKIIVVGAGGAARGVVYGLKKAGAKVTILNRTLKHAKELARDFGCNYGKLPVSLRPRHGGGSNPVEQCDILINTTSVGMWREKVKMQKSKIKMTNQNVKRIKKLDILDTPFPFLKESLRFVKKRPVVMDIVYRPHMTKLLRDAKAAGCKIITGDKMFLGQAVKAFELWTGRKGNFTHICHA